MRPRAAANGRSRSACGAIETGVSSQQSYSFTLGTSSSVSVSLTGLTRDFDCRVKYSYRTNNWGSEDDSWSGTLGAGTHTVLVYPYGGGGPGDYTLTVAVNDVSLVSVVMPTGSGPEEIVCQDGDGNEIDCPTPDQVLVVVGEDPGPPPGTGPGEGDPGPGQTPDPGDGGDPNSGGTTPRLFTVSHWKIVSTSDSCSNNFDLGDRLGSNHGGPNTERPTHSGVDIQANRNDLVFAWRGGSVTTFTEAENRICGNGLDIHHGDGSWTRYCHLNAFAPLGEDRIVSLGDLVGFAGRTGRVIFDSVNNPNGGYHLHVTYTDADGNKQEYFNYIDDPEGRPAENELRGDGC